MRPECRFIPVHTGNIGGRKECKKDVAVYPCVYREHSSNMDSAGDISGLSLCIQGTYRPEPALRESSRFIPVYTGNMRLSGASCGVFAVYPCVYREHLSALFKSSKNRGLSLCIQGTFKYHS